ncbi:hypothetical protein GAG66_23080 [Bacteroides thetaiotaomicron]|nr:hypothetical protein GAG66_23080 [Bacteroides thetaiotaomicron]
MKKNLLYLWALICSVSLLTACSSDDDNTVNDETTPPEEEAVVTAPDVVGTYWGNLDISMLPDGSDQEVVIADGLPKFITFSQVSDTELKMGDIVIDKCAVKKETDASTFTGQQDLTFQGDAAALGTCATSIEGTVQSGNATMNIQVKVPALKQTVKVAFSGVKQVEESGKD